MTDSNQRPIAVGDLVAVVRLKPCGHGQPGFIFRVGQIRTTETGKHGCITCGASPKENGLIAVAVGHSHDSLSIPLWRLKRIPPLDELEGVLAQNEITHPITGKKEYVT